MTGRRRALCLWLGFLLVYLVGSAESPPGPTADEAQMFTTANHILEHGLTWHPQAFTKFGLGQSIWELPIAWAYPRACQDRGFETYSYFTLLLSVWCAGSAATINLIFYLTSLKLGARAPTAFLATLLLGFTTSVLAYCNSWHVDPTLALMQLLAFYLLLGATAVWRAVAAGLALGFAVLCKPVVVLVAPVYFFYLLATTGRTRPALVVTFTGSVTLMVGVTLWYNWFRFGNLMQFGYVGYDNGFTNPLLYGLYGLLLSSGKGFFFYNPTTAFGVLGFREFLRRRRAEAWFVVGICLVTVGVYALWRGWDGDWAWGPRYLIALPPFLMLAALPWLEALTSQSRLRKGLTALVVAGAVVIQLLGVTVDSSRYFFLLARFVKVFPYAQYEPEVWPTRDALMHVHFIPDFSPLVGHAWMLRCASSSPLSYPQIVANPPWAGLNPLWVPQGVHPSLFRYHVWWLWAWSAHQDGWPMTVLLALALGGVGALLLGLATRDAQRSG